MKIRITQLDGKLPNLALMKLSHWHKSRGDSVTFTKSIYRSLFETEYDCVYGSVIFKYNPEKVIEFQKNFPDAIIGGTGYQSLQTVEEITGIYEHYDYDIYPDFKASIGFTQRGCRLKCSFCVVPTKEGKIQEINTINDIWRGEPYPKQLHLLDNDFFGQSSWKERAEEIIEGGFEVCLNQGINVRLIHQEGAAVLAKMKYRDDQFKTKRIYTAWDNRKDERIFLRGIQMLVDAGIPTRNIMVYMLCGYWKEETMEDVLYRFETMKSMGLMPYPMIFDIQNQELRKFQRWVIRRYHQFISWDNYKKNPLFFDKNQQYLQF